MHRFCYLFFSLLFACSNSSEPVVDTFSPVVIIDLQPAQGELYSDRYIHWVFIADPEDDRDQSVFTQRQNIDCHLPDTIQLPPFSDIQTSRLLFSVGDSTSCGIATDLGYEEQELVFLIHPLDTIRVQRHDLEFDRK